MKVAIIICGQIRKSSYDVMPSLNKNLIEPNNADVFLSSWKVMPTENQRVPEQNRNPNFINVDVDNLNISNLASIDLEEQKEVSELCKVHQTRFYSDRHPIHGTCYNAYLLTKAMRMIEESEKQKDKYDFILKIRPDLYAEKINIGISNKLNFSPNASGKYQLSDKLFWGARDEVHFFIKCLNKHMHKILTKPYQESLAHEEQPVGERFYRQVQKFYKIPHEVSTEGCPHIMAIEAKKRGLLSFEGRK